MNAEIYPLLRRLQLTQLEILKRIDGICRKHGISYSLFGGTLLGAVRHEGFIPWDDDLDICMSRSEYERFLRAWEEERPAGYILQNKDNTPAFTQSFTKIRKEHTCFLQYDWERGRYHTGIFIDIFPIDRTPTGRLGRLLFQWDALTHQLFTREFVPPKGSTLQKTVSRVLLTLITPRRREAYRMRKLNRIKRNEGQSELPRAGIYTLDSIRRVLPNDFLDRFILLRFEDSSFLCSAKWNEYLTATYGDYMSLPPEDERTWTHHPIILDFERNYEEIIEQDALPV